MFCQISKAVFRHRSISNDNLPNLSHLLTVEPSEACPPSPLEYINELIFSKLNLLICYNYNNAGIVHSFFKWSGQKSISACLLPKILNCCHHFQQNLPYFITTFSVYISISTAIFRHTKQTRGIKIHQSQCHDTLCKCTQVKKVMSVGCDWCILICLVCFIC